MDLIIESHCMAIAVAASAVSIEGQDGRSNLQQDP
jgi:hypothetical protein